MLAVKMFLDRVKSPSDHSIFQTDSGHRAPALGLDEYLALLVLMRAYLAAEIVICAELPVPDPAMLLSRLYHVVNEAFCTGPLIGVAQMAAEFHIITTTDHKQTSNHK